MSQLFEYVAFHSEQRTPARYTRRAGIFVLAILFVFMFSLSSYAERDAARTSTLIDRNWTFHLGDVPGAEVKTFSDAQWEHVNLPHSFSMPYFLSPSVYSGYGWYRKTLDIPFLGRHRRYFLEFDGVFRVAEVYVNGIRVGEHSGGYTGFSLEITPVLVQGENRISIRVNNLWNARLNPRAGEYVFSGGIYRHVRLVTTSDLHVTWYGTFVTTPGLSAKGGPVHIGTELSNEAEKPADFVLRTSILDPEKHAVRSVETHEELGPKSTETVQQQTAIITGPELWSPGHPALYTAVSTVIEQGRVVDRYETTFGFRWIEWTAEKGFFLNGQHLYFHGANVHQDHAGWGDAVSDDGMARDVRMIKQAGMNFIRGSHYPHAPAFAEECDRQGVLFWSENSFWGIGGDRQEGTWTASAYPPNEADQGPFEESVEKSLEEMIRINRNHPSIVAWSMTNEVFFSNPEVMPKIRDFVKRLVARSHQLDPTRPAGAGGVQRGELDHLVDVAGYNGDGARIFMNPGVPNFVAEYGSTIQDRPGLYEPGFGDLDNQPQYAWRSGQALWCGFDHGSIVPSLSRMGMIDYFRVPKRMWYWYRNAYAGISPPAWPKPGEAKSLRLMANSMTLPRADGRGSAQLMISVLDGNGEEISNTPTVNLEIVSGPGELPTGRRIVFDPNSDISIRDGKAAIEVRAYESGEIHLRASSPGLQSSDLVIRAEGGPPFVAGTTPIVPDRPYSENRATGSDLGPEMNAALNHPTDASSELSGHEGRFANDGDARTYWQPTVNAQEAWWQIDFENRIQVESVQVLFKDMHDRSFNVEVSSNGSSWSRIATHTQGEDSGPIRLSSGTEKEPVGRWLRIQFQSGSSTPIQVTEVQVMGRAVVR